MKSGDFVWALPQVAAFSVSDVLGPEKEFFCPTAPTSTSESSVKVNPTYKVCLFARPAGKISKRSNFFVFGTLRNVRPFLETAGETAFDGGGGDVEFCHFCHFWGIFLFLAPILADLIGGIPL